MVYLLIGKHVLDEISQKKKYTECSIENIQSREKEEWGIYPKDALTYLEEEEKKDAPLSFVFWREKKEQMIENKELFRSSTFPVVEICGNSSLLFPDEFPLKKEDVEGCLIGEDAAWQLFGDSNVIGKSLIYGEKTYFIQGVLPKTDIFVCQASKDGDFLLNSITFYGDNYLEKEKIKEQLGNEYSLSLEESPKYWYFIFARAALFLFPMCFMVFFLFLSRKKKRLFKGMVFLTILFLIGGIVFIFDITPDKLPNRLSDIDFWIEAFQKGKKDLFSLLGIE
ncbi:MAG: ABC transporter permease [Lachnospiraceae bacterium]|nr:ABC transporter permease [Lachnospiraceae bacterium]